MAAQAVYAWPQGKPAVSARVWHSDHREGPGSRHVSQVLPGHEDAHEPLVSPLGDLARDPVIAVDAMGGDYAPDEIVAGALAAQREHRLTTLLIGPSAQLR